MAYVLGFWFADGYMRVEKSYRIIFTSKDRQILAQIRNVMDSTHPIRKRKGGRGGGYTWTLDLYSKQLYKSLVARGGLRRKSRVMQFPHILAKNLADFIRGYFDGDGSVFYVNYISTKNHKPRQELRSNFTSGSRRFLETLMVTLNKNLSLPTKKLGVYNNGGSLKLGYGTSDTKRLLAFMYYPRFPLGLNRKSIFARHTKTNK